MAEPFRGKVAQGAKMRLGAQRLSSPLHDGDFRLQDLPKDSIFLIADHVPSPNDMCAVHSSVSIPTLSYKHA